MAGSTGIENRYLVQGLKTNEMRLFLKCFREHPDGKGYSLYINDRDGNRWELSFGE